MPTIKIPNGDKKFFNAFTFCSLHQLGNEADCLPIKPDKRLDYTPHRAGTQRANPKVPDNYPAAGVK
jgi:hypothetical protein